MSMSKRFREDDPYYYEYRSVRNVYDRSLRNWQMLQKRALDTAQKQLVWIEELKHLVWEVDYAREKAHDVTPGDDGPVSAEIVRLAVQLQQLLSEILNMRMEVVFDYWSKHWHLRLEELGSSKGTYLKSTQLMDEMEQMYVFYRDRFPDGEQIEQRFLPIMQQMLAWRPSRERLHYGFGLNKKFAYQWHDNRCRNIKQLLDLIEAESGFRLSASYVSIAEEKAINRAHEVDRFENHLDYSWAFSTVERRDAVYNKLKPFFNREDVRPLLMNEDEDDFYRLVTFDVYPCECGKCDHYTRSIDEAFYQEETDGWFVCYFPFREETTLPDSFLLYHVNEDGDYDDPLDSFGSLYYIQLRRALRARGSIVTSDAYSRWEREHLGI